MTMDNGEGRTHEDAESGQENAPNWYFDLPGGAWERQEEKNRNLRERVLGNIQEDAEKTKADPFARKFELKPGDTVPSKFELRPPEPEKKGRFLGLGKKKQDGAPADARRDAMDEESAQDDVDWSTEPPLTLAPPPAESALPPLRTATAAERAGQEPQASAFEAGSAPTGDEDFAARMRAWAQRAAAAGIGAAESAEVGQTDAPQAADRPAQGTPTPSSQPSRDMEAPREGMSFESMRAWAERGRDEEHPHFTTAHHEPAESDEEEVSSTPIPLRPRAHDEAEDDGLASMFVEDGPDDVTAPVNAEPRMQPLVLRPWTEPEPAAQASAHEEPATRTKWDEFFNIGTPGEDDSDTESEAEGLAAMRAWAQKGTEPEQGDEVPEEFLKPFDWELQEDGGRTEPQHEQALELVKATGWAPEDEPLPELDEVPATTWEEAAPFMGLSGPLEAADTVAAPVANVAPEVPMAEVASDDEESLDGLFEEARAAALRSQTEKSKGSRFGRLFGRKKSEPRVAADAEGDWVLPESGEAAVVAAAASDWVEAEVPQAEVAVPMQEPAVKDVEWHPEPVEFPQPATTVANWAMDAPTDAADTVVAFRGVEEETWDPEPIGEPEWLTAAAPWEDEHVGPTTSAVEAPAEAVASLDAVAEEPVAETPWWERQAEETPVAEMPAEAVASLDAVVEEPVSVTPWSERQAEETPVAEMPVEAVASVDAVVEERVAETPWWERQTEETPVAEMPADAVASLDAVAEEPVAETPWWEQQTEETPGAEMPVEAVASLDAVAEEPVAETPWWERQAEESPVAETPVEAVASVDAVVEERVAETPWWERQTEETPVAEMPADAVASLDAVAEEPVAETPWWEQQTEETPGAEMPAEAVASLDAVAEEPVAEMPWWEQPAEESAASETPVQAIASVDAVVDEPVAETPWWEQQTEESPVTETPVEAVASVDAIVEEPVAETPWWERQAEETPVADMPLDAVASVDAVAEEPVAETPWWERQAEETPGADMPVEAVASVDAVAEEPVAETPWWERQADESPVAETPVQAVSSVDSVVEEPVAESPWWERQAEETPAVEAVASVDAVIEEPGAEDQRPAQQSLEMPVAPLPAEAVESVDSGSEWEFEEATPSSMPATAFSDEEGGDAIGPVEPETAPAVDDEDDPWAEFVARPGAANTAVAAAGASWTSPPAAHDDEDMWGHVAASAEAGLGEDEDGIDLAASLEDQMEEARAAQTWPGHSDESARRPSASGEEDSAFVTDDEEDVILAAFERHAATPEATVPVDDGALAELLGERADEIVASALEEGAGEKSFLRLTGWAPQRSSEYYDDGWVDEESARPQYGGNDGAGFAPPPWAADELEADEAAVPHGHHRTRTWIREIVETSLLALLVFLSVRASFQNFKVEGSSMYPTLEDGEFLIVNKLVYSEVDMEKLSNFVPFVDAGDEPKRNVFHGPERGDIVVMIDPRDKNTDLIKRVIGLPGETIEIVDGKVYINDFLLQEPYIKQAWNDSKPKITIPPGEYFVMGDNRENSLDSRSSQVGLVPKDLIIGKAMVSYWPTSKFGFAPNESGTLAEAKPTLTTKRIGEH